MRLLRERIPLPSGHSFRVIRWAHDLRQVECVLAPGRVKKIAGEGAHWHYHAEMELTLFTAGEGTRFVGDHIGKFEAGDLVLLGERLPHYWHTGGASSGVSVQWHFPPSHPFWAFPEMLPLVDFFRRSRRGIRFTGQTAAAVKTMLLDITSAVAPTRFATLLRVFALLAAAPERDRGLLSVRSFVLPTQSHYQQAIRDAMRHLIAHFRDEVRLADILQITRLSRPTFSRQFKKHSGRTFSEFLKRLRLEAVCNELTGGSRSVLEIALSCGFTQVSFFNRTFRRIMKCSPTEFRVKQGKLAVVRQLP